MSSRATRTSAARMSRGSRRTAPASPTTSTCRRRSTATRTTSAGSTRAPTAPGPTRAAVAPVRRRQPGVGPPAAGHPLPWPVGQTDNPGWSRDGGLAAYGTPAGVHVMTAPDCTDHLLIPGGGEPAFGPADVTPAQGP